MPYQLTAPVIKTLPLKETDPKEETFVTIRQATRGDNDRRKDLSAEATRIFNDAEVGEVQIKQRLSVADLHRLEVYLTMVDCNILDVPAVEGEAGAPLFNIKKTKSGQTILAMNEAQFAAAWGKLPDEVANEIHAKVLEVNPQWGKAEMSA